MNTKYTIKKFSEKNDFRSYVLGVDLGGTNTSIGIAGVKDKKIQLLFSLRFKTQQLKSLIPAIKKTLDYAEKKYDITVENACIGAAGVVQNNSYVKLTNASWDISTNEILNNTSLKSVFVINDFQAIGYGINILNHANRDDILKVREKKEADKYLNSTKAIIGAGTGLGKSIVVYNKYLDAYVPIPSEGGHVDFSAYNNFEHKLVDFVKNLRNINQPLTYEELLSGRGLESIYLFLRNTKNLKTSQFTKEIDKANNKAALISKYKKKDETCAETFRMFARFYGRCTKNFVLDTLSTGGIYIAGGIANKNIGIFSTNEFLNEFENAYRREDILKKVPIYVVVNYDVSLHGACFAAICCLQEGKTDKI